MHDFLVHKGIATSHSTPYHPTGNSQCERANQTIWRSVKLMLATRKWPESAWEQVLPDALHSIRSLMCTTTGSTPHERFFSFSRKSMNGKSLPDWLITNRGALLRKFRRCKSDPLCEYVELVDVNPKYALVRHKDGRESTVSTSDLAPHPEQQADADHDTQSAESKVPELPIRSSGSIDDDDVSHREEVDADDQRNDSFREPETPVLRRSTRISRPPDRYGFGVPK